MLLASLVATQAELKTSTVSYCKERLAQAIDQLRELLEARS